MNMHPRMLDDNDMTQGAAPAAEEPAKPTGGVADDPMPVGPETGAEPRVITQRRRELEGTNKPGSQVDYAGTAYRFFWPAFAWVMLVFNMGIMIVILVRAANEHYDWFAFGTASAISVLTFAVVAFVFRHVLAATPVNIGRF